MNIKKIMTTVAASSLLITGVMMVSAQDNTATEEPTTQVAPDSAKGGRFGGQGRGGERFNIGGSELMALAEEYTGLDRAALRDALTSGETVASLIEANGGDLDAFVEAATATAFERLDAAVTAERLTEDEAATMKDEITARITEQLNNPFEGRPEFGGRGGADGRRGGHMAHMLDGELGELIESYTGMSAEDVMQAVRDGETVASLVEANGGDIDAFIAEVVTLMEAEIDARATERKTMLTDIVTAMVNGERPNRPAQEEQPAN